MQNYQRWGHYAALCPAEIESIRSIAPVAYVPWGALEWHSQHAPIGLDSFKATGVCAALAAVTGGVVLPAVPFATETIKPYRGFPHSLEFSASLLGQLCDQLLDQLVEEKFRVIVILSGHYPAGQVAMLQGARERAGTRHPRTGFWVTTDGELMKPEFKPDHAGLTETSLLAALHPELLAMERIPVDREPTLDSDGVLGESPRSATAAQGRERLAAIVARGAPQVFELLARHP